jgi:LuxR family transcriptional regulator
MAGLLMLDDLREIATGGFYLALRVGFHYPVEELNELPADWIGHYTAKGYLMADPVNQWLYANTGAIRWSEIDLSDPRGIMIQARDYGLCYGVAISVFDHNEQGHRSFGQYVRPDREFSNGEIETLHADLRARHSSLAPPTTLTGAEIEALRMVRDGKRLKQIAHELGVSEGAIKQRLKNAKQKLGATTSAQATSTAAAFGLI